MNDRLVKLYNEDKEHILSVQLTEDGWKKYIADEPWNPEWVEIMMDIRAIERADFS